jgi:hypothetical protein
MQRKRLLGRACALDRDGGFFAPRRRRALAGVTFSTEFFCDRVADRLHASRKAACQADNLALEARERRADPLRKRD